MTKPLTELFKEKVECPANIPPENEFMRGTNMGVYFEYLRRKPIDLATKKLIEALEFYGDPITYECGHNDDVGSKGIDIDYRGNMARRALAEFRASLEDGE